MLLLQLWRHGDFVVIPYWSV